MAGGCSILRLRGLPYTASEQDLKEFFEGFDLVATHILSRNGKPTGEAYVQFESPEQAAQALKKKNHEHLGSRYIEIFESLEAGLVAKSLSNPPSMPSLLGHVARLRGLPFASTAQDVLQFFKGIDVVGGESGIIFTCTPDGRPAGEAYVELVTAEGKAAALGKHKEKIGSRYIEIFDSSKGDMYQAVQQHGCFTVVAGKRRHHWPAGVGGGQHAVQQSGGQYGEVGPGRGRGQGHRMEEMANAFAGFGISPHDIQVPGPPRGTFMPFGAPPTDDRQYGARPGPQGPMQGLPPHWRTPTHPAPGPPSHSGSRPSQFSRAPGPPSGKGGNTGGGSNRQQQGGGGGVFDYPTTPAPLMMQAPFMLQPPPFMHPQQPGSPWAAAMMATAQQGGGWYGAGMGPAGRGGVPMGMAGPYTTFGPGYYVRSPPGMAPHLGPASGTPPGVVPLSSGPAYPPRTPPHAAANSSNHGGAPQHIAAPGALGVSAMPAPAPLQPLAGPHPEEVAAASQGVPAPGSVPSAGIGGRGDSSHSLNSMSGLVHPVPPARPSSAPPPPDTLP